MDRAVHLGAVTAYGRGTAKRLLSIEIIYAHRECAVVTRLAAAAPGNTGFDAGVIRTLARIAATPIEAAYDLHGAGRVVCGQEVQAQVSAAGSSAVAHQAHFTAHGTRVSVASWNLPLGLDWFAGLNLAPAGNLSELKTYLHVIPLVLNVGEGLPGGF